MYEPDYPGRKRETDRSKMTVWKNIVLPLLLLAGIILLIMFLSE